MRLAHRPNGVNRCDRRSQRFALAATAQRPRRVGTTAGHAWVDLTPPAHLSSQDRRPPHGSVKDNCRTRPRAAASEANRHPVPRPLDARLGRDAVAQLRADFAPDACRKRVCDQLRSVRHVQRPRVGVSGDYLATWDATFGSLEPNCGLLLSVYGTEGQRFRILSGALPGRSAPRRARRRPRRSRACAEAGSRRPPA
jgi:hypothetical protein